VCAVSSLLSWEDSGSETGTLEMPSFHVFRRLLCARIFDPFSMETLREAARCIQSLGKA
jgi:hypothetical protein